MRKAPNAPPAALQKRGSIRTIIRTYELLTPLFGGGVSPQHLDVLTPISGKALRGQLRFWWRACRGGDFAGNLAQMREAEAKIWGAASKPTRPAPSGVQIEVIVTTPGNRDAPYLIDEQTVHGQVRRRSVPRQQSLVPPYGAFPLQPSREQVNDSKFQPLEVWHRLQFTLIISLPDDPAILQNLQAALWAWETFGGVGGRTRRGFGAVRLCSSTTNGTVDQVQLPPVDLQGALVWLNKGLTQHVAVGEWPEHVPHLTRGNRIKLITYGGAVGNGDGKGIDDNRLQRLYGQTDAIILWNELLERYKHFRQYRYGGQGRSYWPEPSAIRALLTQSLPAHATPIPAMNGPVNKFPRAIFGLPIITQFKDASSKHPNNTNADPRKTSLQPEGYERLASPLILRPLACAGGGALGMALLLTGGELIKERAAGPVMRVPLELKTQEGAAAMTNGLSAILTTSEVRDLDTEATTQGKPPLLNGATDLLTKFLAELP